MMDIHLLEQLNELYAEGRRYDGQEQDHSKKFLNLEPDTAHFMSILIQSSRRKRVLEIGTSNGYSTIWLAWSLQAVAGTIVSIDRSAQKQAQADANLRRAGLRESVQFVCGDATEIVATLPDPFDFVFFDADRFSAPTQLKLLMPKLTPDVFILADNVHSHPDEIAGYLAALETLTPFEKMIIAVGKGLSIAYRRGDIS